MRYLAYFFHSHTVEKDLLNLAYININIAAIYHLS